MLTYSTEGRAIPWLLWESQVWIFPISAQVCKRLLDVTHNSFVHWLNDLPEAGHKEWALDLDQKLEARSSMSTWEGCWVRREKLIPRRAAHFCTWEGLVRAGSKEPAQVKQNLGKLKRRKIFLKPGPSAQPDPLGRVTCSWEACAVRKEHWLEFSRFRP